jgi:sRNA-binding protein
LRIELNAGGLFGDNISSFQDDISSFDRKLDDVISSFQSVESYAYGMSGGAGRLESAISGIEDRIRVERRKKEELAKVQQEINRFLELTNEVDDKVATEIKKNKRKFYEDHSWLKPEDPKDKSYSEKFKDWCNAQLEKLQKAWDGLVDWYENGGGKEVVSIVADVVKIIGEVAVVILAPELAPLAVTGMLIGAFNAGVDIGGEVTAYNKKQQAKEAEANGDYETARRLRQEAEEAGSTDNFYELVWNDGEDNAWDIVADVMAVFDIASGGMNVANVSNAASILLDYTTSEHCENVLDWQLDEDIADGLNVIIDLTSLAGFSIDMSKGINGIKNSFNNTSILTKFDTNTFKTSINEVISNGTDVFNLRRLR